MNERPDKFDKSIIEAACKKVLPQVTEWLGYSHSQGESPEVLHDLLRAVGDCAPDIDGYKIARWLDENLYWDSIDFPLCEILDSIQCHLYAIYKNKLEEWVKENNITPKYKVGDKVKFLYGPKSKIFN